MDFLISFLSIFLQTLFGQTGTGSVNTNYIEAQVVRVIDGDTIDVELGGVVERVRYIGIDTPEPYATANPECFSAEASEKNSELVSGTVVRLESDAEDVDDYGRLLRYVYVDDTMVNKVLVSEGYATQLPIRPNTKYKSEFATLEAEAKGNQLGLWSECK